MFFNIYKHFLLKSVPPVVVTQLGFVWVREGAGKLSRELCIGHYCAAYAAICFALGVDHLFLRAKICMIIPDMIYCKHL